MKKKYKQKRWWSFVRARKYVCDLNILSTREWHEWLKSGERPHHIPANPALVYKNEGWVSMRDWLGNDWLSFRKARRYMIDFVGLRSSTEYKAWCRTGGRPVIIPASPNLIYIEEWRGWEHFLGTSKYKKKYKPFIQARAFVHKQGINNQQEWFEWCQSNNRPEDIPTNPHYVYKDKGWEGWRNFIGPNNKWLSYEEVTDLVKAKELRNSTEYCAWFRCNRIAEWRNDANQRIPSNPKKIYKDHWTNWNSFLSYTPVPRFIPFKEAREFARNSGVKTYAQWRKLCREGGKPANIPANPYSYYGAFVSWPNWFGKRRKCQYRTLSPV